MTARRNVARAVATVLGALIVLVAALQGTALAAEPELTISQPLSGTRTDDQTPLFSGTTTDTSNPITSEFDPVTLDIYAGGAAAGTPVQSLTLFAPSSDDGFDDGWEIPAETLGEGQYTAVATQTNSESETGTSPSVSFTIDTTPPAVSIDEVETPTDNPRPLLSGDAGVSAGDEPTVTVEIYYGDVAGGTVAASGSGSRSGSSWVYVPPSELAEGTYTAQAYQEDEAGNLGESATVTFTVLSKAPQVSINTVHSPTDTSQPPLSGTAMTSGQDEPTVTVTIYQGDVVGGTVAASGNVSLSGASWSYTPTALPDGTYTAQATQEDKAHNVGASIAVTFTVDTTAPTVSINSLEPLTKNARPTLSGSAGVAVGDQTSVAVGIYEGGSVSGQPVDLGIVSRSGSSWSYAPSSNLPEGTYTAQAYQEDEAGNVGSSATTTFMVVTNAPAVSINSLASPTSNSTPTLTGSAATASLDEPTVTVMSYEGSSPAGNAKASAPVSLSGSGWSYTAPALKDGTYTAEAVQEDKAHNVGTSLPTTFTIDTPLPKVTVTMPTNKANLRVTQPTFSGSASDAATDETKVSVKVYEGSSVAGHLRETMPAGLEGEHWTITAAEKVDELKNGTYTAEAEQSDTAGNLGTSNAVTFTITSVLTIETSGFVKDDRPGLVSGPTPSFQGSALSALGAEPSVKVRVYRGSAGPDGPEPGDLEREVNVTRSGSRWTTGPWEALVSGTYTVEAEQEGASEYFELTVDATPPQVSLTSPGNGGSSSSTSQAVSGAAGQEPGDLNGVAIHLYAGATAGGSPLQTLSTEASNGSWAAVFGGLAPGTYTAQAEQRDDVGNIGRSEGVTFTVLAPAAPAAAAASPPVASFKWIPADPQAGEPFTLASNSSAGSSPIVSYAWSLAGNGVFTHGESTLTTLFSTPGFHTVELQVTDADGMSSTVAEKGAVASATVPLMQPFPVVRMAGSFTASGARISLLAALAPVGANVTITCHGKGCPAKSQAFVAAAGAKTKSGTVQITFKRFQRFLRSGVVMEIWISKHGQIGKFTRFVIRRDKSPTRVDECLNPAGTVPIVCPS